MKFNVPFIVAGLLSPLAAATECSHNNCLRAIIADAFPDRDGPGDCSKYLGVDVTGPASSATQTSTATITLTVSSRDVTDATVTTTITVATATSLVRTTITSNRASVAVTTVTTTSTVTLGASGASVSTKTTSTSTSAPRMKRNDRDDGDTTVDAGGHTFPAYASACTSFAKYSSACSCVGASAQSSSHPGTRATVTRTTTVTSTKTDRTAVSSTKTVTASVTATTLATNTVPVTVSSSGGTSTTTVVVQATEIVRNGGFESGALSPWNITFPGQVNGAVTVGGNRNTAYRFVTSSITASNTLELKQTLTDTPGIVYNCTFDYFFTNNYTAPLRGSTNLQAYVNLLLLQNITPVVPGRWNTLTFRFTGAGTDTLRFVATSPQQSTDGDNYLSLDNIGCISGSTLL